ncbi:MAG: HDIG domain-containing protein [Chloroflexi bacterium]|nr:HDIG domain-containing protein [Chloroflexota bacterium]
MIDLLTTHEKLRILIGAFERHGKQLYIVGGSVRDVLLRREHIDIDLATDARPELVKALVAEVQPEAIYTVGERFGTIGAIVDGYVLEITTFRSERYKPYSRKPTVTFGTSLEGDLSRRDFTINAIAQNPITGELFDPFDGLGDITARVIRAVGMPDERFGEDPLRMLRAIRFASQLGFDIEAETAKAIGRNHRKLRLVSQERITDEVNKILASPSPGRGIRLLCDLKLMEFIIPEFLELRGTQSDEYHHKDVFEHTLIVLDRVPADLRLRWAALLHDIAKPATKVIADGEVHFYGHDVVGAEMARVILMRMRLPRETTDIVRKLVSMHQRVNLYESSWTDGAVRRLLRDADDEIGLLLSLSRADITSRRPRKVEYALSQLLELEDRIKSLVEQEEVKAIKSPLDGNDLMAIFHRPPGPWIRDVKDLLLSKVLDGELAPDDKETAQRFAQEFLNRARL